MSRATDTLNNAIGHLHSSKYQGFRFGGYAEAQSILREAHADVVAAEYWAAAERAERNALRRAARKAGEECLQMLTAAPHPISHLMDSIDIQHAAKLARKAASNAYAAHPEWRCA